MGVPNLNSLTFKIFRDYNKWHEFWYLPLNFYFYSKRTLRNLLKKCGFKNLYISNHSTGSLFTVLERLLNESFLYRHRLMWIIRISLLPNVFLTEATPWADGLVARCKK